MQNKQERWNLAKLRIDQHGPDAGVRARTPEQPVRYLPVSRDRTSIVEAVRVMEALLSVDGHTIH